MCRFEKAESKKLIGSFLVVLILATMMFSAFYIVHELDHDCSGEDCPFCACLRMCDNTLHQIASGLAAGHAAIIAVLFILFGALIRTLAVCHKTPVSIKVHLNN